MIALGYKFFARQDRFFKLSSFLLFTVVMTLRFHKPVYAEDLPPLLKQKADFALLGVDDTNMRINSGICRIRGKSISRTETINDDIYLLFDVGAKNYRLENGAHGRILLNKDYYYEVWAPTDPDGRSVRRSSSSNYKVTSIVCDVVDPQGLSFFTPVGTTKPFHYTESIFHTHNKNIEKIGYEEISPNIVKVTTIEPPGDAKWKFLLEYYIDTQRGYTVNHIDLTALDLTDISIREERDITWENINNTWVPVTYSFKSYHTGIDPDKPHRIVDWKIEWESVNEKVDPELFDLDVMLADLDGYAAMFTNELGSNPVLLGVHEVNDSFESSETRKKKPSLFKITFLSLGIIFIAAGLWRKILISRRAKEDAAPENDLPVS